jgi:hypothetical protein
MRKTMIDWTLIYYSEEEILDIASLIQALNENED